MVDVQVRGGHRLMRDAADARAGRTVPVLTEHGLDVVLLAVGQLETAAREELDAVVGHGVVRRGDHRAHLDVEHGGQERDARRGDDARVDHVEAASRHAGAQRGRQKITGHARITADQRTTAALRQAFPDGTVAQHAHGGIPQIKRQTRGQIPVRQSTNAIGSKQSRHNLRFLCFDGFRRLFDIPSTIVTGRRSDCTHIHEYCPNHAQLPVSEKGM